MKKLITAAALSLCAAGTFAVGIYDGIYHLSGQDSYASVHQNGNTVIIAVYTNTNISGTRFSTPNGYITPTKIGTWELYNGSINGNAGQVSGVSSFGGCITSYAFNMDAASLSVTLNGISTTSAGVSAGMNCWAESPLGTTYRFIKEF